MIAIGIDVGHSNMAVAVCSDEGNFEVLFFDKYDLHIYEGALHVRVQHFFEHVVLPLLLHHENCVVAIEIQPPAGLNNIEYVLLTLLADYHVVRVHPRNLHKFFHIAHLDYEARKERVCEIATGLISNPCLQHRFANMWRQHDVADAILFCYHTFDKLKPKKEIEIPKQVVQDLEKFRLTESWFKRKC